jgi:hypothetical protein
MKHWKRKYIFQFTFTIAMTVPILIIHISSIKSISTCILSLCPSLFLDICSLFDYGIRRSHLALAGHLSNSIVRIIGNERDDVTTKVETSYEWGCDYVEDSRSGDREETEANVYVIDMRFKGYTRHFLLFWQTTRLGTPTVLMLSEHLSLGEIITIQHGTLNSISNFDELSFYNIAPLRTAHFIRALGELLLFLRTFRFKGLLLLSLRSGRVRIVWSSSSSSRFSLAVGYSLMSAKGSGRAKTEIERTSSRCIRSAGERSCGPETVLREMLLNPVGGRGGRKTKMYDKMK